VRFIAFVLGISGLVGCSGGEFTAGAGGHPGGGDAATATGGRDGSAGGGPSAGGTGGAASGGSGGVGGTGTGGATADAGTSPDASMGTDSGSGGAASTGGATGSGGGAVVEAGPPPLTECPVAAPDANAPCAGSFDCSYGTDPRSGCRALYQCRSGSFLVTLPKCQGILSCLSVTPIPIVGHTCSSVGQWCQSSSNVQCGCTPCTSSSCQSSTAWDCFGPPSPPCPVLPPNEGQPCDSNSVSDCTYGRCPLDTHVVARCQNDRWTLERPSCN
jgi:hypothetical protein